MELLVYIFYSLFVLYIIALVFAKIYSPFWFHQPVYHIYELYPKFCLNPYIKKRRAPSKGIFCIPDQILLIDEFTESCIHLLQGHYIDNNTHLFHINKSTIEKIIPNSLKSVYYEHVLREPSFCSVLDTSNPLGIITSRPLDVFFRNYPTKNTNAHYLDFICTHESKKQKNLSRNLIQTHIYNHCQHDPQFSGVYIFKKEINLCKGIVPLVSTKTYTFVLKTTPINKLPINYSIRHFNKSHIDLWRLIYAQMTTTFDICILPSLPITIEWLSNERYSIYATVYKTENQEHLHGIYVLEDTCITWEQEELSRKSMVRLAGSMVFGKFHVHDSQNLLFFRGFLNVLKNFILDKKTFGILEIPNVSHNNTILDRWREKYELRNETDLAYYFYNMVYPQSPIKSSNFLCLG